MAPTAAEPLAAQLTYGEGSTLAGDAGTIVLKALLENGVGFLVTGWIEGSNPVDAAIADVQHSVLARSGVALRRMRTFQQVERLLQRGAGIGGRPVRGAVVWNGATGMRPAIEAFAALPATAPVVGICFDAAVLRSSSALVLDPAQTPGGVVRAIDIAFALSHAVGHPVLVLLRERVLAMRGTLRCRDNLAADDALALDATVPSGCAPADALAALEPNVVSRPAAGTAIVCGAPIFASVERALATVDAIVASADAAGSAPSRAVTVVGLTVPTVLDERELEAAVRGAATVLVLDDDAAAFAASATELLARLLPAARVVRERLPYSRASQQLVVRVVAQWLVAQTTVLDGHEDAESLLLPLLARSSHSGVAEAVERLADRIPPRGATLHRRVPPTIAAALVLAQSEIGVPARIDPAHSTYSTETGVSLSLVPAEAFAAHGAATIAPGALPGVTLVLPDGTGAAVIQAAAASLGATVELVDELRPRAIAEAIARACAAPRPRAHVIVTATAATVVSPGCEAGADDELLGIERLSASALAPAAQTIVEPQHDLSLGTTVRVRDPHAATASVRAASEVSPAWYDVRRLPATDAAARWRQRITRRVLRSVLRMEL